MPAMETMGPVTRPASMENAITVPAVVASGAVSAM